MERYKTFPPRWSHIRVPVSSRAAAKAAIGLYAPCTVKGYAVQRAAWALVSALGPGALPGPAAAWEPPMPADAWRTLTTGWADLVGPHDGMAVYQRPQQGRAGFAVLLLRGGRPVGFVRLRSGTGDAFAVEQRVLEGLRAAAVMAFWHPRALGAVEAQGWHSLVTTAMPPVVHRPVAALDLERTTTAVKAALADVVARPEGAAAHWAPMHGDLTPWNVRQVAGRIAIIDWEDAGWGPPLADAVLYSASSAALGGDAGPQRRQSVKAAPGPAPDVTEAAEFWLDRVAARPASGVDDAFGRNLRAALQDLITQR